MVPFRELSVRKMNRMAQSARLSLTGLLHKAGRRFPLVFTFAN